MKYILTNRTYTGMLIQGKEKRVVKGTHEPLVDVETFDRIQSEFKARSFNISPTPEASENVFKGKVICACCGGKIQRKRGTNHADWYFFTCISKNRLGADKCTGMYAREEDVLSAVYYQLKQYIDHHFITENQAVIRLNQKLQEGHSFDGKTIGLNLRESGIDEWKGDMSISLDGIPLENSGFGTQNMFKSEIFLLQNTDVDILIIEEPENNLSYSNMSILISKLSDSNGKQLFISTHSSFVANKLGLQCLHLVANARTTPFKSLSSDTYNYFLKLPDYNTLRILLANKAILVEGPADELILQRAYIDNYGKQPIEDGIDVVAVDSLAFQRYCELASLISKPLTVVTDNDGNAEAVRKRYEKYTGLVTLCVESDNTLNTLEPSVLAANLDTFESFKSIIYLGKDIESRDPDSIKSFMIGNKTDWSMRVFTSEKKINYPSYILKAIGIDSENVGDRDE